MEVREFRRYADEKMAPNAGELAVFQEEPPHPPRARRDCRGLLLPACLLRRQPRLVPLYDGECFPDDDLGARDRVLRRRRHRLRASVGGAARSGATAAAARRGQRTRSAPAPPTHEGEPDARRNCLPPSPPLWFFSPRPRRRSHRRSHRTPCGSRRTLASALRQAPPPAGRALAPRAAARPRRWRACAGCAHQSPGQRPASRRRGPEAPTSPVPTRPAVQATTGPQSTEHRN
ncbi:hypothetical protein PVAP13_9NG007351 [Panicum virgatum]|uniref:Uncharacterized protein n=1 Tax=Panicum virgatum TaxID=38727 RepID=A0A8T0MFJ1_PANVG|nr:hypothetical protein PVAP13_9NG007351 [Panicum virgatum]